jgi:hypothetical protein
MGSRRREESKFLIQPGSHYYIGPNWKKYEGKSITNFVYVS